MTLTKTSKPAGRGVRTLGLLLGLGVSTTVTSSGCGDLSEGGPSGGPPGTAIGKLELLAATPPDSAFAPIAVAPRTAPAQGTGTLGAVTVTYIDLEPDQFAPDAVAVTPDGTAWFTRAGGLVRITPDGQAAAVPLPAGAGFASSIVAAGGDLWLANWDSQPGLVRIAPATGAGQLFAIPNPLRRPTSLVGDGHGGVLFTGGDAPTLGALAAGSDQVLLRASEPAGKPITVATAGLARTGAGEIFISDYERGRIGRVRGSGFAWIDVGGSAQAPSGMAVDCNGSVWFVDLGAAQRLGRIDATDRVTYFALPDEIRSVSGKVVSQLAGAPDGSLWFTSPEADVVARLTPTGQFEYVRLDAYLPRGIAIDAQGQIWVTTMGAARIVLGH